MRVLALDIGEKRVGVAVSDAAGRVATPVGVLSAERLRTVDAISALVDDYEAGLVLIGLPLSLDGSEGPQARRVRAVGERLARGLRVTVDYVDERLSSRQAQRSMKEAGVSERQQRGRVDALAATILLQGYLDAERASDEGGTGDEST